MDILVSFYSRTGNTRKVGKEIATYFDADIDEIIDEKDRTGILGWLAAAKDAYLKRSTKINFAKDPEHYELVIVGTPVWAGKVTPTIRTYLSKNSFNNIAFFCTYGVDNEGDTFDMMQELTKSPIASLAVKEAGEKNEEREKIKQFCKKIVSSLSLER